MKLSPPPPSSKSLLLLLVVRFYHIHPKVDTLGPPLCDSLASSHATRCSAGPYSTLNHFEIINGEFICRATHTHTHTSTEAPPQREPRRKPSTNHPQSKHSQPITRNQNTLSQSPAINIHIMNPTQHQNTLSQSPAINLYI